MEETRNHEHIVRIIDPFKRTEDKRHPDIKHIGNKAFYQFGFMENLGPLQQFDRNSRESGLAGEYLQSVG